MKSFIIKLTMAAFSWSLICFISRKLFSVDIAFMIIMLLGGLMLGGFIGYTDGMKDDKQ